MTTETPDDFEYEAVPSRRLVFIVGLLSVVAIALAGAAIILMLVRGTPGTADSCRSLAWASLPDVTTLPSGWTLAGSGFYSDGYSTSFVGPTPSDGTTAPPSIYVRLNCVGADDQLALVRSHDAGVAAGATVVQFANLGEQSFALQDATGGTTVYFRRSGIVAYLVAASSVTSTELQQAATAVDLAIAAATASAGHGVVGSLPTLPPVGVISPGPSAPAASTAPSPTSTPSHAVPDLEAVLPHTVSGTPFTSQSLTGTDAIGTDPASVALAASIKGFGKTVADFQVAESYDATGTVAVTIIGFRLTGIQGVPLRQAIIASWMAAAGSGITTTPASVGGKAVIKVDYGDGGPLDYVYVQGTTVLDVSTADTTLAATVLGLLP